MERYKAFLKEKEYFDEIIYKRIEEIEGEDCPDPDILSMDSEEIEVQFTVYDKCRCASCRNDESWTKYYKVEDILGR